jgi:hypothetical protein
LEAGLGSAVAHAKVAPGSQNQSFSAANLAYYRVMNNAKDIGFSIAFSFAYGMRKHASTLSRRFP